MKAAVLHKTGKADGLIDNLKIEQLPEPVPGDNDVIVKVHYAAINHRDLWITKGLYSKIKLPAVLGSDCSGTVYKIGASVNEFNIGDEVILNPTLDWGDSEIHQGILMNILGMPEQGTFAGYVKINKDNVISKPGFLTFEQAASIPLAGSTAYRALFKRGRLGINENVLVTGIGGGVAGFVLLFAVCQNASVYVTSGSNEKIEKAVTLGAKAGVNYNEEGWEIKIKELANNNIDLIIDGTGGNTISNLLNIANYGSRIVLYGATLGISTNFDLRKVYWKQLNILGTTTGSPADFGEMVMYVNSNGIKPVIDKTYNFNSIHEAFMRMENSDQFGKILINTGE